MAAAPPLRMRPRARPGSVERPVNSRLYRSTWLLFGLPLLVAAFSVSKAPALRPAQPALPPAFDRVTARSLADSLARSFPDRAPGTPGGRGAADNASGVAALIELARSYAATAPPATPAARAVSPAHTLVFVATDGGAFGALGARRFADTYRGRVLAVVDLDSIAGAGRPRLVLTA